MHTRTYSQSSVVVKKAGLHGEVATLQLGLPAAELGGRAREDHRALAEHEHLITHAEGHPRVLLDEEDGHASRFHADHQRLELAHATGRSARRRFSPTSRWGKICRPSGTYPIPEWKISCGACPVMSRSLKRTAPSRGGVSPMIERRVVVLPAPFRPSSTARARRRPC